MAKILVFVLGVLLLCGCDSRNILSTGIEIAQTQDPQLSDVDSSMAFASDSIAIAAPEAVRPSLQQIYSSQEGMEELTGDNDGAHIVGYHTAAGIDCSAGCRYPYCAAGVRWSFDSAGISTAINAWSPTAHNADNVVYEKGKLLKDIRQGDVMTLYFKNLGRIGHTGFIDRKINSRVVKTFEFNTNSLGSRDGGGNYFKYRPIKTLHSITRWTDD